MTSKTFSKGERVNVYVHSGAWSSTFYTGVVDSMTPSGKQVRVTMRGASKPENHSVKNVTPMTAHEIAVDDWISEKPAAATMYVNAQPDRGGPGRCDLRQNHIALDLASLTAVRDDLDALIAWVAKRPVRP